MTQTYETKRLLLKPIDLNDQAFIFKEFSNDIINQYLFDAEPLKEMNEALDIIRFYIEGHINQQARFILLLKDNLIPIGTIGYHAINHEEKTMDIGYDLYPDYHHKGYMREALTLMIDILNQKFPHYALHACIYKDNQRSIHAVKYFGFTYHKTYFEHFRGDAYEHHIYRL